MQFGKQWNVSSALHSHHTPTRRVAMCNNNNKHCNEGLDRELKQRFYAVCHPLQYLPSHLVALEGHEVALDIWDVHEVFLPALIPEEAVAPRPAEVSHRARLHLALHTRGAGVLLSTLNSLCAVMDTFLRDNGLIRILLLHLPNLLGSLLTYATLQRYSLQYFTAAHNHNVCVTQTTNTQRCVVSGCVSTIKHIFSPIVLSIPNSGTRIYVYFFQFLAATRNFVAKVFSGNV